ncbi:GNAT family N-acetyltransferase [Oceanirhabdus sp. W0125-5]|uniref:GNAT family N-acetyltransferase n=1 Tax=Oceanirhabdus sp. W0125-5 TaxID=2999116 RepID=UPI0022F2E74F|nr:GNAT family N-acetyltransferase [Oceanirhabdus sp. W0125-5]WBW97336.1 GNAT family N-acetyltransferase [Oceanirhabdus sp. W0125-5]
MAIINDKKFLYEDKEILITSPKVEDAENFIEYLLTVAGETEFLLRKPEEFKITVDKEKEIIKNTIEDENILFVTAKVGNKIVGNIGFHGGNKFRTKHAGSFGIAIVKEYWGMGLGKELISTLLEWTDSKGIKRVELKVDEDNERAIKLYNKMGFEVEGRLKKEKYIGEGVYKDSLIMARVVD